MPLVQLAETFAGVDAQFFAQDGGDLAVGAQRVGLPVGSVEGEHELAPEPFAEPVFLGQRVQLADDVGVPVEGEFDVHETFECAEPFFGQPLNLLHVQQFGRDVGERRAAPQGQRLAQFTRFGFGL